MAINYTHAGKKAVEVLMSQNGKATEAYDFTPAILTLSPETFVMPTEFMLANSMIPTTVEGAYKLLLPVKKNLTSVTSSAQLKADAEQSRKDQITLEFDQDYTKQFQYNVAFDTASQELNALVATDLASLINDEKELVAESLVDTLLVDAVAKIDLIGADGAALSQAANANVHTATTDLITDLYGLVETVSLTGMKGHVLPTHPQLRGIESSQIAVYTTGKEIETMSKDTRFQYAQLSPAMVASGVMGLINKASVYNMKRLNGKVVNTKALRAIVAPTGNLAPMFVGRRMELASKLVEDNAFAVAFSKLSVMSNFKVMSIKNYLMAVHFVVAA